MAIETRDAQLMQLVEPQFVTLTKKPANKTSFKVLRDATGAEQIIRKRKKVKRGDENLVSIDLPAGITREEAEAYMEIFSLGEEFTLTGDEESGFRYVRGDEDKTKTVSIDIGGGVTANVRASVFERAEDTKITGVTLVGVEFANTFDEDQASEWLESKGVAFREEGLVETNGLWVAVRYEVPEEQEVRRVDIEEGVVGLVCRTESVDIPQQVYRSVIEEAYGSWGWGSLDFNQAVADYSFSYWAEDAIYMLRDTLYNILFYSMLPVDERKVLVKNACDQFSNYIASLIDALPREVARQARAESNANMETNTMATKDTTHGKKPEDRKTERNDNAKATDKNVQGDAPNKDDQEQPQFITRTEVQEIMDETITAKLGEALSPDTLKAAFGAALGMKRADEEEETDPTMKALKDMAASIGTITEGLSGIKEEMQTMRKDIDEVGASTVKRGDNGDEEEEEEEEGEETRRSDGKGSVFKGMFGSRG